MATKRLNPGVYEPDTVKASSYTTAVESMSLQDKVKLLESFGQPDLIKVFNDFKPKAVRKRTTAPLDQRVAITITGAERARLDRELAELKNGGEPITASQFIRNKALGTVDLEEWRAKGEAELKYILDIERRQGELRKSKRALMVALEEELSAEDQEDYERELAKVNGQLNKLLSKGEKRGVRLTGRMSMAESETVKWRAQRLCLTSSDYLRMQIFGLTPASSADAHLTLDAKKRFYIAIMDVAANGWGAPPTIYECSQCGNYLEEIQKLRARVKQLEAFL